VTNVEMMKIEIAELNKQLYNMYDKVVKTQERVSVLEALLDLQRQCNDIESNS